jgi:hypothetical protein
MYTRYRQCSYTAFDVLRLCIGMGRARRKQPAERWKEQLQDSDSVQPQTGTDSLQGECPKDQERDGLSPHNKSLMQDSSSSR